MSPVTTFPGSGTALFDGTSFTDVPRSALAWSSVVLTGAIFPVAYVLMTHLLPWAFLDSWVAPAILVSVILAAATTGLLALLVRHEHSWLVVLALIVSLPLAVFSTFMMAGEILFPH